MTVLLFRIFQVKQPISIPVLTSGHLKLTRDIGFVFLINMEFHMRCNLYIFYERVFLSNDLRAQEIETRHVPKAFLSYRVFCNIRQV